MQYLLGTVQMEQHLFEFYEQIVGVVKENQQSFPLSYVVE